MNSLKKKFGARVRELRKSLGFSQDKLADRIDWETSNLSNLENGKCFLKSENIEKFAKKALKVKSANIIANVALSSFLLAVGLPKLTFVLRKLVTGSDAEPGLVKNV